MNIDNIISLAKQVKDGDKIAVLYVRPVKVYLTDKVGKKYTGPTIFKESVVETIYDSTPYFDKIRQVQGTNSNPTGKPKRDYNHVSGILYESEGDLYVRFNYVKKEADASSRYFIDGNEVSYESIEPFLQEGERRPTDKDKASNQFTTAGHEVKETSPNAIRPALYKLNQIIELTVEPQA